MREATSPNLNDAISEIAHDPVFTQGSFEDVVKLIVEHTGRALGCARVSAWEYHHADHKHIQCMTLWDEESGGYSGNGAVLDEDDAHSYLNALRKDTVLAMDDVSTDPRCAELMKEYLPAHKIRSMLDAPFQYDGKLAGVICAEHVGARRRWTRKEQSFSANIASLLSIAMERDQRHKAEQALLQEKERYRQLAHTSPAGIVITVNGVIEFANPALNKIVAAEDTDDLRGLRFSRFFSPPEAARAHDRQQPILASKSALSPTEYRVPQKDGSSLYLAVSSSFIQWNGQDAIQSHVRDVTGAVIDRQGLERFAEQLRILSHSFPGGFTYTDGDLVYRNVNSTFARWCNTSNDLIVGQNVREFLGEDLYGEFMPDIETLLAGQTVTFEFTFRHSEQAAREVRISHVPDTDVEGKVRGFFTLITNLTEAKETERALRHAQKMEAVGQLTGGLAHDFNNLLMIVMGSLELIQDELPETLKPNPFLESALSASQRGADLTRKLMAFSRKNPLQSETVNINSTLKKLLSLLNRTLTASVLIRMELEPELATVYVNEGDLENAILNLSLNARDAMQGAGTLTITTQNVEVDDQHYALLSVQDDGGGIAESIRDRVFEPFYTTKSVDKGSGLGLSMVYGFVKRSNGMIDLESEEGTGTTFNIHLPRFTAGARPTSDQQRECAPLPRGSETILVVDDEIQLLQTVTRMLGELGYQTITAESGTAALEKLRTHPGIQLVLTDVVLGGDMDGYDLAFRACEELPGVKILLSSGHSKLDLASLDKALPEYRHLPKPYKMAELAKSIRSVLEDSLA